MAFKYHPLVAYYAKLGFALSKPNGSKHLEAPDFSSLNAAMTCARRTSRLHVFWRRRNGQDQELGARDQGPGIRADRNVCPTWQLNLGGPLQTDTELSRNESPVAGLASYHTRWPNFQGSFGPSFPSFRQLAAPWAKRYDGRRGPMAADYASRLRSRMFLCASSARCFVAEAVRTRNRNTMVPLFDPVWELPCPLAPLLREARYRQ